MGPPQAAEAVRVIAFVLPLGIDTFAIAAALGTLRPRLRTRIRISALFVVFEVGMPLIGVVAGHTIAAFVGSWSEWVAAALLVALGVWLLVRRDTGEEELASRLLSSNPLTTAMLGVSISIDELAIGFSLGLSRLPLVPVLIAIGVQTFVASQLGLAIGRLIGERVREGAERLAGLAFLALGVFLIGERLV
ncbi:MAG: manganese efflux pump [Candidatus Dormibacteraeota bacterium]|nr:manganese efflux pump [Candidatus Dormibacteraeota bacterium]